MTVTWNRVTAEQVDEVDMKQMFQKINELNMGYEGERSVNDDVLISGLCKQFHEAAIYLKK